MKVKLLLEGVTPSWLVCDAEDPGLKVSVVPGSVPWVTMDRNALRVLKFKVDALYYAAKEAETKNG